MKPILFLHLSISSRIWSRKYRSSRLKVFLEISQNSQGNTFAATYLQLYLKRYSGTSVFLWILWNFQEHLFHRRRLGDCFWYNIWRNFASCRIQIMENIISIDKWAWIKNDVTRYKTNINVSVGIDLSSLR